MADKKQEGISYPPEQDHGQIYDLSNRVSRSVVAVVDALTQRGAFKGEELAGVGRLRETFLAEVKEQQGDAPAPEGVDAPVVEEAAEEESSS